METSVSAAYLREFDEPIARPAMFHETEGGRCRDIHLTSTAYLRTSPTSARLLSLYLTHDGSAVTSRFERESVVVPAGAFRVLVVIIRYPETSSDADLENWESAQAKINRDHVTFATSRGYREPIVSFENTNLFVDAREAVVPDDRQSVRDAAARKGVPVDTFQFIVSINIDPLRPQGGFAGSDGFIYMGNYSRWSRALTLAEWINVANAVYHHEVAHHWGWPAAHDWSRECGGQSTQRPFIVAPILLGWIDLDGDAIPEILDPTPYGRN